ncbi:MAG: hypothetical protein Q8L98_02435 [Chlamydiales bacterium]|nr:hypothetical protein [Chlamydiales bacterium]
MKKLFSLLALALFSNSVFASAIFVADYTACEVTAYELLTGEQMGLPFPITEDETNPLALATNLTKTLLYVVDQAAETINIYDLSTGKKLSTLLSGLPTPSDSIFNSEGTILYIADFDGSASAYHAMTGPNIQAYLTSISGSSDIVLNPEGNVLYVSNFSGHNLTIYNATASSQLSVFPVTTGIGTAGAVALGFYMSNAEDDSVLTLDSSTDRPIAPPLPMTEDVEPPVTFAFAFSPISPPANLQDIAFPETFAFKFSPISPPVKLSGYQKKNDFALEYELFNRLSWIRSPSQASGYNVYRNGVKIATLGASTLSYADHNRKKRGAITYSVTAFNQLGIESAAATCVIK